MSNKTALEKLIALPMEGDYGGLLTGLGQMFDDAETRIDDLADEGFATSASESLEKWYKDYGLAFDAGDSDAFKLKVLLAKLNETGGMSIPYYVKLAGLMGEVMIVNDSILFRAGISKAGDRVYPAEYAAAAIIKLATQHRFPFRAGISKAGDPIVSYDKRNSIEEMMERLKPAHIVLLYEYFQFGFEDTVFADLNFGFEDGNFNNWDPGGNSSINDVTVRTGTYSVRMIATGTPIVGVTSDALPIEENEVYIIDSYHNVTAHANGTYLFWVLFYADEAGTDFISSGSIYSKAAVTAGWEQGLKSIGPASLGPDINFPAGTRSIKLHQTSQTAPDFEVFMDDVAVYKSGHNGLIMNDSVIDFTTVRTDQFSAKLIGTNPDVNTGVGTDPIVIAPNQKYQIEAYINIPVYTSGFYNVLIRFFSDIYGTQLLSAISLLSKTSTTAGWEQLLKTIALERIASDFNIPADAKSFTLDEFWQIGGVGTSYIDDIAITIN